MTHSIESFDALARRYRPELAAYLYRVLGDWHDAEDACQEALLRAQRAHARLRPQSNARAWLYKIATNTALNLMRQRRRQAARSVDVDPDSLPAEADSFDRREEVQALREAIQALPAKQRAALMLRRFHDLSYSEIAASLGGSPEAARANVYQAIRRLRQMLAE